MFESSVEICVFKNDSVAVEIKKECSLVLLALLVSLALVDCHPGTIGRRLKSNSWECGLRMATTN